MKLFHGSDKIIEKPIYGLGRSDCDYGSGFYMCDEFDVAKLWASQNDEGGYVNVYHIDTSKMNILYLNHNTNDDVLKWITLLCSNRIDEGTRLDAFEEIKILQSKYLIDVTKYDMIIGYRADDSYYEYTRAFLLNQLPIELLKESMESGKLGLQYVLISKKAFNSIEFIESIKVQHDDDYSILEQKANNEFENIMRKRKVNQTYLRDVLREDS